MAYTIFLHMNATKAWLSLSPDQRRKYIAGELAPILRKYTTVRIDFYDAEAFSAFCSDIAVLNTDSLPDYANLMDDLRKSSLLTVPYFEIVQIVPAVQAQYLALAEAS